jgi:hypothetical protein
MELPGASAGHRTRVRIESGSWSHPTLSRTARRGCRVGGCRLTAANDALARLDELDRQSARGGVSSERPVERP